MKWLLSVLVVLSAWSCKTADSGSGSSVKDIADAKVITQRPDGNFDVFCKDGTSEIRSREDLLGNHVCEAGSQAGVSQRCECRENNGPDLYQIGFNPTTNLQLWETKLQGWNSDTASQNLCMQRIREDALCRPAAPVAALATHCECPENNGPDLMFIGQNSDSGDQLWKTKINGWNADTGNADKCFKAAQTEPLCSLPLGSRQVYKRCDCPENNGPDLVQTAFNASNNKQLWSVKLAGWSADSGNADKCFAEIRNNPVCQLGNQQASIASRCYCKDNNGPDLQRVLFSTTTGETLQENKIAGWNADSGNSDKCFAMSQSEPICRTAPGGSIVRRCSCPNSNGPDLIQKGIRVTDGSEAWSVRLTGWNNDSGNQAKCEAMIQSSPLCK